MYDFDPSPHHKNQNKWCAGRKHLESSVQDVQLSVRCVVKGYHHHDFSVNIGELFTA